MVSQYNVASPDDRYGVKNLMLVVGKRLTIRGFIVGDPDMGAKVSKSRSFPLHFKFVAGAHVSSPDANVMLTPRLNQYAADHQKNLQQWIGDGSFIAKQSITTGMDNAIDGLLGMLKGENFGKAVLAVSELDQI